MFKKFGETFFETDGKTISRAQNIQEDEVCVL